MKKRGIFISSFLALLILANLASAQVLNIMDPLSGSQEVPPVATPGSGTGNLTVDLATGLISGSVTFSGLTSGATAGHIHNGLAGVNGPVIIPLEGGIGGTAGTMTLAPTALTPVQLTALRNNQLYINIHTLVNPGGEIRGQIVLPAGTTSARTLTDFDTMVGVSGPFLRYSIRGIPGGNKAWTVGEGTKGFLDSYGGLVIDVRGLVLRESGQNPVPIFYAFVSCLSKGVDEMGDSKVVISNVSTEGFPADIEGNAFIDTTVMLPKVCIAPIISVGTVMDNMMKWFAVMGAREVVEEEEAEE